MIPREILKNIRLIELRVSRFMTGTLTSMSLQSPAQFRWIPRAVPDGQHFDFALLAIDCEIYRVRPRRRHFGFVSQACSARKSFWLHRKRVKNCADCDVEPLTHSRFTVVIPNHGFVPVPFSVGLNYDRERHFVARIRSSISANTWSTGFPRPGFLSASSARRSSSMICSGVRSSSSNSSRSRSKTSHCSSTGSLWTCSRIFSVVLTPPNYAGRFRRQATFHFGLRITHHALLVA